MPRLIVNKNWSKILHDLGEQPLHKAFWIKEGELPADFYRYTRISRVTVVIGDLAGYGCTKLREQFLEILENAICRLVCVASEDMFSRILLSRFVTIEKEVVGVKNNGSSESAYLRILRDNQPDLSTQLVKEAPSYLRSYDFYKMSNLPGKRRLIA